MTNVALEVESGMWSIDLRDKSGAAQRLSFEKDEIVAGRVEGNDVVLPNSSISKRHTRIERSGEEFFVTDLGSTNGTWVDGRRTTGRTIIPRDATVIIGDFTLAIVRRPAIADGPAAGPTSARPGSLSVSAGPPEGSDAEAWCVRFTDDKGAHRVKSRSTRAAIGSGAECEIAIAQRSVLEAHAVVELRDGLLFLWPANSGARVAIAGRAIVVPTLWREGEAALIGEVSVERVALVKPAV